LWLHGRSERHVRGGFRLAEAVTERRRGSPFGTPRGMHSCMATAYPLDPPELPRLGTKESHRLELLRQYAEKVEREDPGHLRSVGMNAEQYAASMSEPGRTVEECVQAGLMSAAECRYIQGCATREDLTELGYSSSEIECILAEQVDPVGCSAAEVEAAWSDEIQRRLTEVDAGLVTPVPWAEARLRIFAAANGRREAP